MMRGRKFLLITVLAVLAFAWSPDQGHSFGVGNLEGIKLEFHGHVQSIGVLRDTTGFVNSFFDEAEWVQWRQELKVDLAVIPDYIKTPRLRVSKVFMSYRGAYDALFGLTSDYDNVPDDRQGGVGSPYDLGLDDTRLENDMRELFVDVTWSIRPGTLSARLGKQILLWGEADFWTLTNIVAPQDYRYQPNFSNPDDLAAPVWMGRFDYNHGILGPFTNVSFQASLIPDNKPTIFGPADATAGAPYSLFVPGLNLWQNEPDSGLDNMQAALRLGLTLGNVQSYFYYYDGFQHGPSLNFSTVLTGNIFLDHPRIKMYGYSFNYNWYENASVIWGEVSQYKDWNITDLGAASGFGYAPYDVTKAVLGYSRNFRPKWIGTESAVISNFQVYWQGIDNYDYSATLRPTSKEDTYRVSAVFVTDYHHGTIGVTLAMVHDFEGLQLFAPSLRYSPDFRWFYQLSSLFVMGESDAVGDYSAILGSSEVSFKIGYQW